VKEVATLAEDGPCRHTSSFSFCNLCEVRNIRTMVPPAPPGSCKNSLSHPKRLKEQGFNLSTSANAMLEPPEIRA